MGNGFVLCSQNIIHNSVASALIFVDRFICLSFFLDACLEQKNNTEHNTTIDVSGLHGAPDAV